MRTFKIVADSSANLMTLNTVPFGAAPMKIITAQREFVDDTALDLGSMVHFFKSYKGRSQTSCPNPEDWLTAFGDGEDIFCVTVKVGKNLGLCSFYAEKGGLLVGYEKF